MAENGEFYVGYRKQAPPGLARRLRRTVLLLFAGAAALATLLAATQRPFDPGHFEFGRPRSFEGVVEEEPWAALVLDPAAGLAAGHPARYLLVAEGKHGAQRAVAGLAGRRVRLRGTRIVRGERIMLEVVTGSVETLAADRPAAETAAPDASGDLGAVTLRGEIVDSKCFLGVMKPGRTKPHRACATRCISGGIPPIFYVELAGGGQEIFLLVDERGGPVNDRVLDLVAEPLEITGRVQRRGDDLLLAADPAGYRRLED